MKKESKRNCPNCKASGITPNGLCPLCKGTRKVAIKYEYTPELEKYITDKGFTEEDFVDSLINALKPENMQEANT